MALRQHEAAQLQPEMASHADRKRRGDALPLRCQPAFPSQPDHLRRQHQTLQPHDLGIARRQLTLEAADPPEQFQQKETKLCRRQAIKVSGGGTAPANQ